MRNAAAVRDARLARMPREGIGDQDFRSIRKKGDLVRPRAAVIGGDAGANVVGAVFGSDARNICGGGREPVGGGGCGRLPMVARCPRAGAMGL